MNSRIIFFCGLFLFITGCGVKQKPMRPVDQLVPSYIQSFTPIEKNEDQTKKTETEETKPQSNLSNP